MLRHYFIENELEGLGTICSYSSGNIHLESKEDLSLPIYRFTTLESLLAILCNQELFVARKQTFSDWHEGVDCMALLASISHFSVPGIPVSEKQRAANAKEDKQSAELLGRIPVSCWTLDGEESYYQWMAYAKGTVTVRIGTTVGDLVNSISDIDYPVFGARVRYEKLSALQPHLKSLFYKHPVYACEHEYRFCFYHGFPDSTPDEKGISVRLTSSAFIHSVLVHSPIGNGIGKTYVQLLKKLLPKTEVRPSLLREREK